MPDTAAIFTSICFIIALVFLFVYLNREVFDPLGKRAPRATAGVLSKFALLRRFKVLSNVRIKSGGEDELIIENMLIGYFGILLVKTLGARGDYYGTLAGEKWSVVKNDKKTQFDNPIPVLEKQESALRSLLSKNGLYNIPIEHIIYISSKSTKTTISITNNGEILLPGKLAAYLDKTRFEKDLGLDVNKVADVIGSDS